MTSSKLYRVRKIAKGIINNRPLNYDMIIEEFDTEAEAIEAVEDEAAIEKALFANSASCPILDHQGDRIVLHIPGEPNFELQIIAESQLTA